MHSRWELQTHTSCISPTDSWELASLIALELLLLQGASVK